MKVIPTVIFILGLFLTDLHAQGSLTEKAETLAHKERVSIKKRAYEFLLTWNTSADMIRPLEKEIASKVKENRQKGKDPYRGLDRLQGIYDEAVFDDGTERSFLAESFAQPMLHELKKFGLDLPAADIYTAQYVIKYVLGVPRFNHRELDVDDHDQMERELASLISEYPDNDAHDQEVDGHVIRIFTEEADAYFEKFVAANQADLANGFGSSNGPITGLSSMTCEEKYKYLKSKGIMH